MQYDDGLDWDLPLNSVFYPLSSDLRMLEAIQSGLEYHPLEPLGLSVTLSPELPILPDDGHGLSAV